MYDHVKNLTRAGFYVAPADKKIIPYQIPENAELIELITGGKVFFETESGRKTFGAGAIFWHQSGEETIYNTPPDDPYQCVVFQFSVNRRERPVSRVSFWDPADKAVEFGMSVLRRFHSAETPVEFGNYIYAELVWRSIASKQQQFRTLPSPLRKIIAFIDENYSQDINIARLAETGNISRPYLFSLFRQYIGETPHRYIIQRRMRQAKILLAGGVMPIKAVAEACGFESLEVFYRQFKSFAKMTPAKYRQSSSPYESSSPLILT